MKNNNYKIAIIGLGYVGLPLAIEFGKKFEVFGYDTNKVRVSELKNKIDVNKDILLKQFKSSKYLTFSHNIKDLNNCNIFIITVPTPIKKNNMPDLQFIKKACVSVAKLINKNNIVILESTVFPGLTEEFCVPILEKYSKLKYNIDFFCGYSPERINPNDKVHNIRNIVKVTSGSNTKTAKIVNNLYKQIIDAGTHLAKNIKIAEAAKVIENSQRDLNIAFMNELCLIFNKLGIDTNMVLEAASTKWNFINFKPGLVGGHCIGVDPYYLTYQSKRNGYLPKVITAGRNINDNFSKYIIKKAIENTKKIFKNQKLKFMVMGLSFKENCVDFRNSKSVDIIKELKNKKYYVDCFDPYIDKLDFLKKNKIKVLSNFKKNFYHCVIICVSHEYFIKLGEKKIRKLMKKNGIIFDVKNIFANKPNNIYL